MSNRDQTETTLSRHLQAFAAKSVDAIMADYGEESVLIVPSGALRGLRQIRSFFARFIGTLPAGFVEAFRTQKLEIVDDVGYLLWCAAPWVQLGTDTFVVRNGKIVTQTFAPHPLSWLSE